MAAWSPVSKHKTFRGRKAALVIQNVMAACSYNMMFTFVYTSWEAIIYDSCVFLDALSRQGNNFPLPNEGKNFLFYFSIYKF